mmetsp:Transcript_14302/g.37103  ORF Transcript_14302/g.37103 Transcript_14302/m.37103 type:complete len:260 (+) Transcript_14302:1391-2170(+)
MVVVHLHQLEVVVVVERALAEGLGRVDLHLGVGLLVPKPAKPDALAGGAAVLLDHARLEGAALLEARDELLLVVVRKGVHQAAVEVADLDERVLGAHLRLDLGRRPHELALRDVIVHEVVEALLGAVGRALRELARVDAHDERVVLLRGLDEALEVLRIEEDKVARATSVDHAVGDGDRVDAVAIGALVGATVLGARHLELHNAQLVLGVRRGRLKRVVALGDVHTGGHSSRRWGWGGGHLLRVGLREHLKSLDAHQIS